MPPPRRRSAGPTPSTTVTPVTGPRPSGAPRLRRAGENERPGGPDVTLGDGRGRAWGGGGGCPQGLLGLFGAKPLGVAAGAGLVLFHVGAVLAHVRAGGFRTIAFPGVFLPLAVGAPGPAAARRTAGARPHRRRSQPRAGLPGQPHRHGRPCGHVPSVPSLGCRRCRRMPPDLSGRARPPRVIGQKGCEANKAQDGTIKGLLMRRPVQIPTARGMFGPLSRRHAGPYTADPRPWGRR
ncbi:DoxX family protein [Streptomyces sp. NBC_00557]|uniref:DoxX family protein n=1 Tax=Streptomyces sp. NBC_00557 TaxID=2975776 RepID=UPI003FCD715A